MATQVGETVIKSAKPSQMNEAEKRDWYLKLRNRMRTSPLAVKRKAAGFVPYWARRNDPVETSRLDLLGFRVVRETDLKNPRYQANGLKEDGTYQLGDVILMECPEEEYEFYKQENLEQARQMSEGVGQAFMSEAAKQNVPAFEVDEQNKRKG